MSDHYTNMGRAIKHQRMVDHCAEHHLSDHYANMIQLSKVISIHGILNMLNIKRNDVKFKSHCICHSIVKVPYIGKGKKEVEKNMEQKN